MLDLVVVVQAAVTWALVGLIWTMQLVHYPLLAGIAPAEYGRWQRFHMRRITMVVAPLMIGEAAAAAALAVLALRRGSAVLVVVAAVGGLLLLAIWLVTALVQARIHGRLTDGFEPSLHRRLVRSNWVRTLLWTARGLLAAWWLWWLLSDRLPLS